MYEILLILAGMAVFYLFMVFAAVKVKEKRGKTLCPICATVSLTWLSMLVSRELNIFAVNTVFLAVLMGASVCGVMYLVEKKIESAGKKVFWKIASTLVGVLLVLRVVGREYDSYTALILAAYLLILFFSLKKKKGNGKNGSDGKGEKNQNEAGDKETWLKKLENCC